MLTKTKDESLLILMKRSKVFNWGNEKGAHTLHAGQKNDIPIKPAQYLIKMEAAELGRVDEIKEVPPLVYLRRGRAKSRRRKANV